MKLWKISDIRHVKKENVTFRLILIKSSSFLRFFFYDKKFFLSPFLSRVKSFEESATFHLFLGTCKA